MGWLIESVELSYSTIFHEQIEDRIVIVGRPLDTQENDEEETGKTGMQKKQGAPYLDLVTGSGKISGK